MPLSRVVLVAVLGVVLLSGCMGVPVRDAAKVDLNAPAGKIEGNQFTGIRYPFKVSAPPNWKVALEHPEFMEDLGYEKPGLEESEVFLFNPETRSNLQIDFTPAGRYAKFSQESIEWLTDAARGSFKEELEKDYGKGVNVTYSPATPYSLKGVSFAAKKFATYTIEGTKREQGWIYAFTEPYQIFILYMIVMKDGNGNKDQEDIRKLLDSFEVFSK